MFWSRTYTSDKWELRRWNYVRHSNEFGFMGYSAYFCLRNRKTGRQKVVKVGSCCWLYGTRWQLDEAIFKKTGIEIVNETALMTKS